MSSTNGLHRVLYIIQVRQTELLIITYMLSGVNQVNQKLHTPVKLTTDKILVTTRKARHLRHMQSSTSHICRDGDDIWSVT